MNILWWLAGYLKEREAFYDANEQVDGDAFLEDKKGFERTRCGV